MGSEKARPPVLPCRLGKKTRKGVHRKNLVPGVLKDPKKPRGESDYKTSLDMQKVVKRGAQIELKFPLTRACYGREEKRDLKYHPGTSRAGGEKGRKRKKRLKGQGNSLKKGGTEYLRARASEGS